MYIGYMKFEMLKEKKNPAMKRDEHLISLEHKGKATPSRPEIMKEVAKLLKTKEELIIIDKILSNKGVQSSKVYVLSYRKRDEMPKYKLDKMKERMEKIKPKKAAEEKPAEAEQPKEEQPVEEPKQEVAEEQSAEAKEEAAETDETAKE